MFDVVPRAESSTFRRFPHVADGRGPDPYASSLFSGGSQGSLPPSYPSLSEGPNLYPVTQPGGDGGGIQKNCNFPGACGGGRRRPSAISDEGGHFSTLWISLAILAAIILFNRATS